MPQKDAMKLHVEIMKLTCGKQTVRLVADVRDQMQNLCVAANPV